MAITPGNTTNSGTAGNSAATSCAPVIPTGIAAGDLWVLAVSIESDPGGTTRSVTAPGGFSTSVNLQTDTTSGSDIHLYVYYRWLDASDVTNEGTAPYTFNFSASTRFGWIGRAYRGVANPTIDDATPVTNSPGENSTTPSVAGITTVTDHAYLVGILSSGSASAATHTPPAALSEQGETKGRITSLSDAEKTPAGDTGSLQWTVAATVPNGAVLLALRPAAASSPGNASITGETQAQTLGTIAAAGKAAITIAAASIAIALGTLIASGSPQGNAIISGVSQSQTAGALSAKGAATKAATGVTQTQTLATLTADGGAGAPRITPGNTTNSGTAGNTAAASCAPIIPAGVAVGDLWIVAAAVENNPAAYTITPPVGEFTQQTNISSGTGSGHLRLATYYHWIDAADVAAIGTGPYTFSFSGSARYGWGTRAYRNVDSANPLQATTVSTGPLNVQNPASPGITTATTYGYIVGILSSGSASSATHTAPASLTERWETQGRITSLSDAEKAAAGATGTLTWSTAATTQQIISLMALRPAQPAGTAGNAVIIGLTQSQTLGALTGVGAGTNVNLVLWSSDLHSATGDPGATWFPPATELAWAQHLAMRGATASLVTGDTRSRYSNNGDTEQFRDNFYTVVVPQSLVIRGNHDQDADVDPSVFTHWNGYFPSIPMHSTYDWSGPKIRFVMFHAYRHTSGTYDTYFQVDASEETWIEAQIAGMAAGYRAVLCSHAPIWGDAPGTGHAGYIHPDLGRTTLLAYMAANPGKVIAAICGHQHQSLVSAVHDSVTYIWGPSAAPNGNNAYTRITYDTATNRVNFNAYFTTTPFAACDTGIFVPVQILGPNTPGSATITGISQAQSLATAAVQGKATKSISGVSQAQTLAALTALELQGWFASTTGSAGGDGSIDDPWDIATALAMPAAVGPGDTIYLREGTYTATQFKSELVGTVDNPITVRAHPGERVTLDRGAYTNYDKDAVLWITGAYSQFRDLEITNSASGRVDYTQRGCGVWPEAEGVKIINCVIHDCGEGIAAYALASGVEAYGNVIYYNGAQGVDRGHGHGMYLQGGDDLSTFEQNIIHRNFGNNTQLYATATPVHNITLTSNVYADPGRLVNDSVRENSFDLLVGTVSLEVENITIDGCYVSAPTDYAEDAVKMRQDDVDQRDITFTDNWVSHQNTTAGRALSMSEYTNATVTGNRLHGHDLVYIADNTAVTPDTVAFDNNDYWSDNATPFWYLSSGEESFAAWKAGTGYDATSTLVTAAPTGNWVAVDANKYEAGRANVVIFNHDGLSSVAVDLSGVLSAGQQYEIRDAFNYYGSAVAAGTYAGGTVPVPMTGLTSATPVGYPAPAHPGPAFGAFVLLPVVEGTEGNASITDVSQAQTLGTLSPQARATKSISGISQAISLNNLIASGGVEHIPGVAAITGITQAQGPGTAKGKGAATIAAAGISQAQTVGSLPGAGRAATEVKVVSQTQRLSTIYGPDYIDAGTFTISVSLANTVSIDVGLANTVSMEVTAE